MIAPFACPFYPAELYKQISSHAYTYYRLAKAAGLKESSL